MSAPTPANDAAGRGPRHEFRLPDLGEGLTEAEIVRWLVRVGDVVAVNDPLVEVETAKAVVEIPSPVAGTVLALGGAEGAVLAVGAPLLTFATAVREPVLVGYGPAADEGIRRRRRRRTVIAEKPVPERPVPEKSIPEKSVPAQSSPVQSVPEQSGPAPADGIAASRVLAKPPVRRRARDLGMDLRAVTGTGPGGTITREDLERHQEHERGNGDGRTNGAPVAGARTPLRGVRRATAEAMTRSAAVPQASVTLTVDVSESVALLDRLRKDRPLEGRLRAERVEPRLTFLSLVCRAVLLGLRARPVLTAHYDEADGSVVVPPTTALGIAVAGPRGLLVPKIRSAEACTLSQLAQEIERLARAARAGSLTPAELTGGDFTVSNVGVFGVDGGTSLLVPGETGILCVGAVRERPWVAAGALVVRSTVTLTLTIDHRVVDGAEAAAFLHDVGDLLSDPATMLARL